jgi:hypothetical protein
MQYTDGLTPDSLYACDGSAARNFMHVALFAEKMLCLGNLSMLI